MENRRRAENSRRDGSSPSIPPARHTKHFRTVAADERERWDDRQERGGMMGETRQDDGRGRWDNGRGRQDDGWDEAGWGQGGHRQLAYSSSPLFLFSNEIFGPTVKSPNKREA
ncbi:hypothetical protein B0H14DRAFT_2633606 [Mycena olivaceomarginata]|nr:hypothetical protein B0H14DRAFT_2633606 [Mycena olivaceomarginata]